MEVIRPGDTVIIGMRDMPSHRCDHASDCDGCEKLAAWAARMKMSQDHWSTLMPGVNLIFMPEPDFTDYQIVAVYRPEPQAKRPPPDQSWVEMEPRPKLKDRVSGDWTPRYPIPGRD